MGFLSEIPDFFARKIFSKILDSPFFFFYNTCEVFIVNMFSKLRKDDVYGNSY